MTADELTDRALDNLPDGGRAQFDPLTLLILSAVISAVIQWLVTQCLNRLGRDQVRNPGMIDRWRLRGVIRQCCDDPSVARSIARSAGPGVRDGADVARVYGGKVYAALIVTGTMMADHEIASVFGEPA